MLLPVPSASRAVSEGLIVGVSDADITAVEDKGELTLGELDAEREAALREALGEGDSATLLLAQGEDEGESAGELLALGVES